MTPEQLKEIDSLLESLLPDPWFLSDCEGELQIWQEGILRNVTRGENGEITGYRPPASYQPSALIGEWELNAWDPGHDEDDDRRRAAAQFIVAARKYMPALVADLEQARRGGKELGKTVEFLAELIKSAFVRGADDPIGALNMLGNHLGEVLESEGGLSSPSSVACSRRWMPARPRRRCGCLMRMSGGVPRCPDRWPTPPTRSGL